MRRFTCVWFIKINVFFRLILSHCNAARINVEHVDDVEFEMDSTRRMWDKCFIAIGCSWSEFSVSLYNKNINRLYIFYGHDLPSKYLQMPQNMNSECQLKSSINWVVYYSFPMILISHQWFLMNIVTWKAIWNHMEFDSITLLIKVLQRNLWIEMLI